MKFPILFAVLALVGGCVTFHPQPLIPSRTASAFETRTLDDPGLKRFLEENLHREIAPWPPPSWDFPTLTLVAFYDHPDLNVARAQWGVAEAGVITAGGRPNPNAGFTPQYNADAAAGISPWTLSFTLDIPVETAGKRGHRIAQARRLSGAARLNIAGVAWQVRSRLRTRLLDLHAAGQTEAILKGQQAAQEDLVRLLEQRLSLGEVSRPEVTQAHISLDQTRLSLREAQRQSAEARARVADALGLPGSALDGAVLSFEALDRPPPPAKLPSRDVRRRALSNRPDVLGALEEYAASESALQLEIARQYPDIHLGPGYAWDQADDKWALGLSATLPVFDRNRGPIAEADARRTEAAARFTALQARAVGEIDLALAGALAALQKLETAETLLTARKKQQQSVQAMFDAGEMDRLDLLSARLELNTSELSRLDALVQAQQSLGLLEDALQRPIDQPESFPAAPEKNPRP